MTLLSRGSFGMSPPKIAASSSPSSSILVMSLPAAARSTPGGSRYSATCASSNVPISPCRGRGRNPSTECRGSRRQWSARTRARRPVRPGRSAGRTVPRSELYSMVPCWKRPIMVAGMQHERLAVGLGLQIGDDRHLADVEFLLARHRHERAVDRIDFGEAQRHPVGFDLAVFQRLGVRDRSRSRRSGSWIFSAAVALIASPRGLRFDFMDGRGR